LVQLHIIHLRVFLQFLICRHKQASQPEQALIQLI
jgi:hypothetical protein